VLRDGLDQLVLEVEDGQGLLLLLPRVHAVRATRV
jgi:hypothetical protein